MEDLWSVELNLDDDYAKSTSYHVDKLINTMINNISYAQRSEKTNNWALVGVGRSLEEALQISRSIQEALCRKNNREMLSVPLSD